MKLKFFNLKKHSSQFSSPSSKQSIIITHSSAFKVLYSINFSAIASIIIQFLLIISFAFFLKEVSFSFVNLNKTVACSSSFIDPLLLAFTLYFLSAANPAYKTIICSIYDLIFPPHSVSLFDDPKISSFL